MFDTAIGVCGLAWGARGVRAVRLPDDSAATTLQALERTTGLPPREPHGAVCEAIERIRTYLAGGDSDLGAIALDWQGVPPFHRKACEAARRLARGTTATYGELAALAGSPGAARAVGQAMAKNPFPLIVPCHRVLAAGSRPGGFSAPGGLCTKERLLGIEGTSWQVRRPSAGAGHRCTRK